MKYAVVIMDGASGWAMAGHGNKTCLELAKTPNLDDLAGEATVGMAANIPAGMEPGSAVACMSLLGYDPAVYYRGRSAIEAVAMDVPIASGEIVFRCNLVNITDGKMTSYSSGHIATREARALIASLNRGLGNGKIRFYPGVSYRHICKLKGIEEALQANCTPPHDIPNQPVADYLPSGEGSEILNELMQRSELLFRDHPVNTERRRRGELPATGIWLFWASGQIPKMRPFREVYGVAAAISSGVDLLKGLARLVQIDILDTPGVTDNVDNDYAGQAEGAIQALAKYDMVVIHVEAPDEAAHSGSLAAKVKAIESIDENIISRLRKLKDLKLLVMPDHPTPIELRTHAAEPVPFLIWGPGHKKGQVKRFTENEARGTGLYIAKGCNIMHKFLEQDQEWQ